MSETAASISLRDVTRQNFKEVIRLQVRDDQNHFVASNVYSLAESYIFPGFTVQAIYSGDTPVGFMKYGFSTQSQQYWINRLMIAAEYQGRGYGREAMKLLIERLRAIPDCQQVFISYEPDNQPARSLYTSLGFKITGAIEDGEEVACLDL